MFKFLQKKATTFWEKAANVALAFVVNVAITIPVIKFYEWLFSTSYSINAQYNILGQFSGYYRNQFWIDFFLAVIMAPLWEEIVFRKFPLDFVKGKDHLMISMMLFSSVIFGLGHYGVPSLLIQGVGGFIIACIYVKNGYSYWSAVALHALWNLSLTLGLLNL